MIDDVYYDEELGEFILKDENNSPSKVLLSLENIKIEDLQGNKILTGVGAPTSTAKKDDLYLDTETMELYKYVG